MGGVRNSVKFLHIFVWNMTTLQGFLMGQLGNFKERGWFQSSNFLTRCFELPKHGFQGSLKASKLAKSSLWSVVSWFHQFHKLSALEVLLSLFNTLSLILDLKTLHQVSCKTLQKVDETSLWTWNLIKVSYGDSQNFIRKEAFHKAETSQEVFRSFISTDFAKILHVSFTLARVLQRGWAGLNQ